MPKLDDIAPKSATVVEGGRHYRTIALIVIMMGVMMSAVDTTAVVMG